MPEHRKWPSSVWIVRHGESVANVALHQAVADQLDRVGVVGRDADVALSTRGEQQARLVGRWFRELPAENRPGRILCSPFQRARRTAELILEEAGLQVDILVDERLRERDLGLFENLTHKGMEQLDPAQAALQHRLGKFYHRPPGGESWCDIILRLRSLLTSLVIHEDERRLLIVCHKAVIACLRYIFEQLDEQAVLQIDRSLVETNGAITEYQVSDDGGRARMLLVRNNYVPES